MFNGSDAERVGACGLKRAVSPIASFPHNRETIAAAYTDSKAPTDRCPAKLEFRFSRVETSIPKIDQTEVGIQSN